MHLQGECDQGRGCPHGHSVKQLESVDDAVARQFEANVQYWPTKSDGRGAPLATVSMIRGLAAPGTPANQIDWPPWKDFAENINREEYYESEAEYSDTQSVWEEDMHAVAVPVHRATDADYGYSDEDYGDINGDFDLAEEREE